MKAPEYIQLLDNKPSWRAIIFIFREESGKCIHIGSILRGNYVFFDRFVSKFVRDYKRGTVKEIPDKDLLEPNTFNLEEARDKGFIYLVEELTKLSETDYGQIMLKSPGNKGHILRAVVNRDKVLYEMYKCTFFFDVWDLELWDDRYVTWKDLGNGLLDAHEILDFLDKRFQIFEFYTNESDMDTVDRIMSILKTRREIARIQRKKEWHERGIDDYLTQ